PVKAWEELESKLAQLNAFDAEVIEFRRFYVSAAVECELDKQGRVLIPPGLRVHAGMDKSVLWAGHGQKAELWALEQWQQLSKKKSPDVSDPARGHGAARPVSPVSRLRP
ncbi:MAG: hypothetical protein WKG00_25605, partial [Polyangiaceae bacterium]